MNIKTIKTLNKLKSVIKNSLIDGEYDVIVYEPNSYSNMAKITENIFDCITKDNLERYKTALPKIVFKNVELIGAMFNNPLLGDWILDKIEFENTNPITFHGMFRYTYNISNDAIKEFFVKHRNKGVDIYGTADKFLNEYVLPQTFNNLTLLYLTLDFFRLKEFPNFKDITYQLLVSPKLNENATLDDIYNYIENGVLI